MPDPGNQHLTVETASSIQDIPIADWQRLAGRDNPFLRYEFFRALEDSGCTSPATGWTPCHLVFKEEGRITGVAPAYLKSHSMGEYVFDWAWAEAWHRHGLEYYPKLLLAIPFTPSRGPRLMLESRLRERLTGAGGLLQELLDALIHRLGAHSWHLLFADQEDQALLRQDGELHRIGCQFHWHNRGYDSFEDFLAQLTSRKRKSIRRERRQVADQGITFEHFQGSDIPDPVLSAFYTFYQATYLKRGQRPYLTRSFFEQLRQHLPEHLHIIMARRSENPGNKPGDEEEGELIAGALFVAGRDTLYGRYWGCLEEYNHLHFETCYYQGVELAIRMGLRRFDAGAQGEHKLVRGFEPVITHSWHGIDQPGFVDAVERFTREEADQVMEYYNAASQRLPYRQTPYQ